MMLPSGMAKNEDTLRKGMHHIGYEISMLLWCIDQLIENENSPGNQRNLFVEGMAIHGRTLITFFEPFSPKDTDFTVDDYFDERPRALRLDRLKQRADRFVAHLTTERFTDEEARRKGWQPKEFEPLLDLCGRFLKKIFDEKPHLVSETDKPKLEAALAELSKERWVRPSVMTCSDTTAVSTTTLEHIEGVALPELEPFTPQLVPTMTAKLPDGTVVRTVKLGRDS